MSDHYQDANQTPAPARSRRGPAFSLNPFQSRSSGSQFATPPRFQFPDEPETGNAKSTFRSSGQSRQGFYRGSVRRFDISSPVKGERHKPVQVSDDEIDDDFDDGKATGLDGEALAELEDLFPVSRRSNKRPRLSSHSGHRSVRTDHEMINDDFDDINDSSPPIPASPSSPPSQGRNKNLRLKSLSPRLESKSKPSEHKSDQRLAEPQTPNQAHALQNEDFTTSAVPSRPRFILSANYTPASIAATPATSTPQPMRKKPTFVLPRSPSPGKEDDSSPAIPAPFSPVANRTLRRSGRPKSGASKSYLPGGMAEHLRDWVMEADMKRKAVLAQQSSLEKQNDARFLTTGRIESCHGTFLKSSGPVILAQMKPEDVRRDGPGASEPTTVLLLGAPTSSAHRYNGRPSSSAVLGRGVDKLKSGDVIGLGAGLSWQIEVDSINTNEATQLGQNLGPRVVPSSQSDSESDFEAEDNEVVTIPASSMQSTRKTWLVAAEWDLLSQDAKNN